MARGAALGVKVRFWNVTNKYSTDSVEQLCPWPFERAYISSDLRVVPCCIIANPDVCEVGTVDGDFTSIWKGEAMTRFRDAHLKGEVPAPCRFCYRTALRVRPT
jgi:pyrroloquinoline quinone biosynthesis protein E